MDLSAWKEKSDFTKEETQMIEMVMGLSRKLKKELQTSETEEEKKKALYAFYRKYHQWTLSKDLKTIGINRSPLRDIILDYPWKECGLNRFMCLKLWEKICP